MNEPAGRSPRRAGIPQGLTVVTAMFLPVLAIVAMFPAVPVMIDHFAADPNAKWKVPSMVTAPGLGVAAIAIFMGVLVDRFGRRKLLLVSTFFYGFFGALPFVVESLDQLYLARICLGVAEAAILTTLNTLIGDYWNEHGRRNWLTVQGMAGPAMSSVLLYFAGSLVAWRWNAIFLVYLVAFPIFVAMYFWLFEPDRDDSLRSALGIGEAQAKDRFPWGTMAQIGAATLFCSLIYYVFIINGGLVWKELGVSDSARIGQLTALPSLFILAGAGLFWILGRLDVGARGQFLVFLGLVSAGLILMGQAQGTGSMILAMIIQQTGAGMAIPVLVGWTASRLPFQHRGRGMGLWTASFFLGQFASPLVVSVAREQAGSMQAVFVLAGVIGVTVAVLAFMLTRHSAPHVVKAA